MLSFIGAAGLYYGYSFKTSSREISYVEFIQNYLEKNDVKLVTLCEDKTGSTFKFRAIVDTVQGERVHLVLP